MVHETEYICKEYAKVINDLVDKVNKQIGRNAVEVTNYDETDECSDMNVYFDGKTEYLSAIDVEAEAYLNGILKCLEESKKQAGESTINIALTAEESSVFGCLITHLFEQNQISNIHLNKQEKDLLSKIHKDIVFRDIHK